MANRLGVTLRAYANYERGEREVAVAVLLALYKRFAIDPVWVMLGHPNSRPKRVAERRINGAQIEDAEY
jgi:transcriptional regulator with XRE-family HTH domain